MIALMVGALEVLSLVEKEFDLPGPFFEAVAAINNHFELLGFGIIGKQENRCNRTGLGRHFVMTFFASKSVLVYSACLMKV